MVLHSGVPNGIRTRVLTVKESCPRPLDDGDFACFSISIDQIKKRLMLVASSADMRPLKVFTFLSTLCPFGPGTAWIQTSTTPFAAFASTFGRACSSQRASRGGGVDLDDCEDRVHGCSFKKCCGCMRYSLRRGLISVNGFFRKNTKYFCVAKPQHLLPSKLSRKRNQKKQFDTIFGSSM